MWFNPMMSWLLKSPLHGLVSQSVMLVSVSGRKSGRIISTPTNYLRDGSTLLIISWRDRNWWRNLRNSAKVWVLLAGKERTGLGSVVEEEKLAAQEIYSYYQKAPQHAKYVAIHLDEKNAPIISDCENAAKKLVVVKIQLD